MSIKFIATNPDTGRKTLGIIIEEGNIQHLKNSRPIHFSAEELSLPKIECNEITIIYYPTLQDAITDLKAKGYITKDTPTTVEKKKGH